MLDIWLPTLVWLHAGYFLDYRDLFSHSCNEYVMTSHHSGLWLWPQLLSTSSLISSDPSLSLVIYNVKYFMSKCNQKLCLDYEMKKHCGMSHCFIWRMSLHVILEVQGRTSGYFFNHLRCALFFRRSWFLFCQPNNSSVLKCRMTSLN